MYGHDVHRHTTGPGTHQQRLQRLLHASQKYAIVFHVLQDVPTETHKPASLCSVVELACELKEIGLEFVGASRLSLHVSEQSVSKVDKPSSQSHRIRICYSLSAELLLCCLVIIA
jgi:hypothetical protein